MVWNAVALPILAVEMAVFVVVMVVTGRRHRRLRARLPQEGPRADVTTLTPEELGLLVGGGKRLAEVTVLRLHLERRVVLSGARLLAAEGNWVAADPDAGDDKPPVRLAVLRLLTGRRRGRHVQDVLHAGAKVVDAKAERDFLVARRLVDKDVARNADFRERVVHVYVWLETFSLIGYVVGNSVLGTLAGRERIPMIIETLAVFFIMLIVTAVAARGTGGQIRAYTPLGERWLAEGRAVRPDGTRESILRYVALHGIGSLEAVAGVHNADTASSRELMKASAFAAAVTTAATAAMAIVPGGGVS